MPGVLLGLPFDIDPTGFYEQPMTNVTPRPQKGGGEFDRQELAKADAPKANGKSEPKQAEPVKAEPEAKETLAVKDETKAEVTKSAEPDNDPNDMMNALRQAADGAATQVVEREPGNDSAASTADTPTPDQELEQWFRDQMAEIDKTASIPALMDLRDVTQANATDAQMIEFKKASKRRPYSRARSLRLTPSRT
jgi:hypothetical protein